MTILFRFTSTSGGELLPTISLSLVDDLTQLATPILSAIVDTGADGTILPLKILQDAGFRPNRQRRQFFTARTEQPAETVVGYSVTMRIGNLELSEVDIYGSRTINEVILGRNVLNRMVFTYDGLQQLLEVLEVEA
jgi:predicted aspartyl protease